MQNQNWTLVVSIVCGLAAAALGFKLLNDKTEVPQTVALLVTQKQLDAGQTIAREDLAAVEVPVNKYNVLNARTYHAEDLNQVVGRKVSMPIPQGSYLNPSITVPLVDLNPRESKAAFTIRGAGLAQTQVQPGDLIDVYLQGTDDSPMLVRQNGSGGFEMAPATPRSPAKAILLFKGVRVLAVNGRLTGSRQQLDVATDLRNTSISATTFEVNLTLEMSQQQIEEYLVKSARDAKIFFSLPPQTLH